MCRAGVVLVLEPVQRLTNVCGLVSNLPPQVRSQAGPPKNEAALVRSDPVSTS